MSGDGIRWSRFRTAESGYVDEEVKMRVRRRGWTTNVEQEVDPIATRFHQVSRVMFPFTESGFRCTRRSLGLVVLCLVLFAFGSEADAEKTAGSGSARPLLLATTTSIQESGLLDALLPGFTQSTGHPVRVIAVGSGAAIEMARKGDADVVIAHAPDAEEALIRDGIATSRTSFMANYFVLVGPKADPAGVAKAETPEAAFALLFRSGAPFVSRADQSGTYTRELSLAKAAGIDPTAQWPGRIETGSGMGPSLLVAGEKRAYILSDIATYLAFRDRIELVVLSRPAPSLRNVYSILQLDPKRFDHPIESEGAAALERHLLSPEGQRAIDAFGRDRFGEALFVPLRPPRSAPTQPRDSSRRSATGS